MKQGSVDRAQSVARSADSAELDAIVSSFMAASKIADEPAGGARASISRRASSRAAVSSLSPASSLEPTAQSQGSTEPSSRATSADCRTATAIGAVAGISSGSPRQSPSTIPEATTTDADADAPAPQASHPPPMTMEQALQLAAVAALGGAPASLFDAAPPAAAAAPPPPLAATTASTNRHLEAPAPPMSNTSDMLPSPWASAQHTTTQDHHQEQQHYYHHQHSGRFSAPFGSPLPSSVRSSFGFPPMNQGGDVIAPRLSLGAHHPDVADQLVELGPPAIISDASGQEYIVQPVRRSLDLREHPYSQGLGSYTSAETLKRSTTDGTSSGGGGGLPQQRSLPRAEQRPVGQHFTPAMHQSQEFFSEEDEFAQLDALHAANLAAAAAAAAPSTERQRSTSSSSPPLPMAPRPPITVPSPFEATTTSIPMSSSFSRAEAHLGENLPRIGSYGEAIDVRRLYMEGLFRVGNNNSSGYDGTACNSTAFEYDYTAPVRMSMPVELELRQELMNLRQRSNYNQDDDPSPPPAEELQQGSRSSGGNGTSFPDPDLAPSGASAMARNSGGGGGGASGVGNAGVPSASARAGSNSNPGAIFSPFSAVTAALSSPTTQSQSSLSPRTNNSSTGTGADGGVSRGTSIDHYHQQNNYFNPNPTAVGGAHNRSGGSGGGIGIGRRDSTLPGGMQPSSPLQAGTVSHRGGAGGHYRNSRQSTGDNARLTSDRLAIFSTLDTLVSAGGISVYSNVSEEVDEWEIAPEEIQLGPRIGIGSYGEVFRGQWRQTDVAVKRFLDQELGARVVEGFAKEVSIMKRIAHPNLVMFMGACTHVPDLCIVTQYVPRGSLYKLLHRTEFKPDERRRLRMALDVARGMNYLHTCRPPIIHRDLKSPNLLVDTDLTVKVCDFGLSRVRNSTILSAKSQAGTPEWTAPEVLQGGSCSEASDVYSFGVILWELITCKEPWAEKTAMQVVGAVGFNNERLDIPDTASPALKELMRRCFGPPNDRPLFSEIIPILKRQLAQARATTQSLGTNGSDAGGGGAPPPLPEDDSM